MKLFETGVDFINGIIDLLAGVCSHECDADKSVLRRDSWSDNRCDKDPLFEKHVGEDECFVVVADEERDDGGFGVANFEAEVAEGFEGIVSDVPESLLAFGFGTHNVKSGKDRGGGGRRDGGSEDVGADIVFHPVDRVLVGGDKTAYRGERFGECAHYQFDIR